MATPSVVLRLPRSRLSMTRLAGGALAAVLMGAAALASVLGPHDPTTPFADRAYAPPMRIRVWDGSRLRLPFVYPQVLENRLLRTYRVDRRQPVALGWFANGRLISIPAESGPLLLLGGDTLGRDVFSRLLHGARLSMGVTAAGALGALLIGFGLGGLAGGLGGRIESVLMLIADFVLVLPGAYLVLVLRGALPLVLSTGTVFSFMALLFAVAAWPHVARGVRAIIATERACDYAEATRAAGAGPLRLVGRLLPAAHGFASVELLLLVPALLVAEATVSFLGLGFPEPHASWGTQLQQAANATIIGEAPWMLAPAAGLFLVVLAMQLLAWTRAPASVLLLGQTDRRI
jgi:peptide/nickel transport system permease protein